MVRIVNKTAFKNVASYCLSLIKESDALYKKGAEGIKNGLNLFKDNMHILDNVQKISAQYSAVDHDVAEICINLASDGVLCLSHTTDIETQIRWHKDAFKASQKVDRPRDILITGNNLGISLIKGGKEKDALDILKECLKVSNELGEVEDKIRVLNNMGIAYKNLKAFSDSIECYEKKLEILEQYPEKVLEKISVLGNLGIVHKEKGEYEIALKYHNTRLKLAKKEKHYPNVCRASGDIGITYFNMGNPEKAIEFFDTQLKIARKHNFYDSERKAQWGLCQALHLKGDTKGAILIGKQALKLYENDKDPFSNEIQKHLIDWSGA